MQDSLEKVPASVVFHYPLGVFDGDSLGEQPEGFPSVEYFQGHTTDGEKAYIAPSVALGETVRNVMDHSDAIPSDVAVSIVPVASIDGGVVNLAGAVSVKARGSRDANGDYATLMSMVTDMSEVPAGDVVVTEDDTVTGNDAGEVPSPEDADGRDELGEEADPGLDASVFYSTEDEDTTEEDELLDSADEEVIAGDGRDESGLNDDEDADSGTDDGEEFPSDDGVDDTEDDFPGDDAVEDDPEDADRRAIFAHLVDEIVPNRVTGTLATPLGIDGEADMADLPVFARLMVDTLIRQANTLYNTRRDEAAADVGYLTDEDVQEEKTALIRSLLDTPTPPLDAYFTAAMQRNSLVAEIQDALEAIQDEFQRREDEWVKTKLDVILPELRTMFRENYPVKEETVAMDLLTEREPDLDSADAAVADAMEQARRDVELRLHHQSEHGRQLSQLMGLADARAEMEAYLAESTKGVVDAWRAEQEAEQARREADVEAATEQVRAEMEAALVATAPVHDDTDVFDRVVDDEAEAEAEVDSVEAHHDDTEDGGDVTRDDSPASADGDLPLTFYPADEEDEEDAVLDSEDSETTRTTDGTTDDAGEDDLDDPAPAPNTDPETGEDLDFREDTTDEQPEQSRKGIRRFFGHLGRHRRGRH